MTKEKFDSATMLLKTMVDVVREEKSNAYQDGDDVLHNFKEGCELTGQPMAQVCWGYLTKHLVALGDKVRRNDFSDIHDFTEKCVDTVNYIYFLHAIGRETFFEDDKKKRAINEN